jgi:nitrite reductase/ring-hydroxylating ferredoxin subunit/uncharacterized membrane protein
VSAAPRLLRRSVHRLGALEALDTVAVRLGGLVHRALAGDRLKNLASGTWLGHPLHPVLSDLPIGCWSCATALDLAGGESGRRGAELLAAAGAVTAVPTLISGFADWSDTNDSDRRIGVVHAASGLAALSLYATSFAVRVGGATRVARALRLAGFGAAAAGGYLGGHLTFGRGIGVDHTLFEEAPSHWTRIARESELGEGRPVCAVADRYDILLYRSNGTVHAVANRCTHAGAPLDEGSVDGELQVTCPWHGSRFRLADGSVARGPATAPQPAFDTRIRDGDVEVRLRPH